jgi:hypothetical protein
VAVALVVVAAVVEVGPEPVVALDVVADPPAPVELGPLVDEVSDPAAPVRRIGAESSFEQLKAATQAMGSASEAPRSVRFIDTP